jgi:very-short-patch-repair endonuclease
VLGTGHAAAVLRTLGGLERPLAVHRESRTRHRPQVRDATCAPRRDGVDAGGVDVRTEDLAAPAVVVGSCRRTGWVRVTRGLHRRADAADPRLADLLAWQALLPVEAAFSALTAAALRGWDLPPLPDLPVCAAMPYGATAPVRPGQLRVTRHRLPPPHDALRGLRVTTASETLLTCASLLSLLDLVVVVDSALRARDVELLELHLLCRQRRRGVGRLRQAVALADPESDSVMETLLRVLHVVCGVEVETQHTVRDAHGTFVARGDLWLVGTRTLVDYDGAVHADRPQQRKDRRRDRRVSGAQWVLQAYTDGDVLRRPVTVLREADAAVGRPHDPGRIRAWTALFRESCWTPAGRTALSRRHGLRPTPA